VRVYNIWGVHACVQYSCYKVILSAPSNGVIGSHVCGSDTHCGGDAKSALLAAE